MYSDGKDSCTDNIYSREDQQYSKSTECICRGYKKLLGWCAMAQKYQLYLSGVIVCTLVFLYAGVSLQFVKFNHAVVPRIPDPSSSTITSDPMPGTLLHYQNNQTYIYKEEAALITMRNDTCQRKINVAFLKVHKAGSSTIMNIFLRFGVEHNLNVVLPTRLSGYGFNYLGHQKTLNVSNITPIPKNETYNILCNHVVYNREAFAKVMPEDSVYVGILREPLSQFLSASMYYGFLKTLANLTKIQKHKHSEIFHQYFNNMKKFRKVPTMYVRNRMSFDFGLPVKDYMDNEAIRRFIRELDKDFRLVMILERLDESLVLMKRLLCWELKDILFVPLNINKYKIHHIPSISQADVGVFRSWAKADIALYGYFYRKFDRQVRAEGYDFQDEVAYFSKLQKLAQTFCSANTNKTLSVKASKWNKTFYLRRIDCQMMMTPEGKFVRNMIMRARLKYQTWLKTRPFKAMSVSNLQVEGNVSKWTELS